LVNRGFTGYYEMLMEFVAGDNGLLLYNLGYCTRMTHLMIINHYHSIIQVSMIIIIEAMLTHQSFHFIICPIMIDNERCATLLTIISKGEVSYAAGQYVLKSRSKLGIDKPPLRKTMPSLLLVEGLSDP
jgi:hypothetical protein